MIFSTQELAMIAMLLVNTGALFYWGGGVRQILRDHERRITDHGDRLLKGGL